MYLSRHLLLHRTLNSSFKHSPKFKHVGAGGGITGKIQGLDQTKKSNFEILKYLLGHIWTHQPLAGKMVVGSSLACLFTAKYLNVQIPQILKKAVDDCIGYTKERERLIEIEKQKSPNQEVDLTKINSDLLAKYALAAGTAILLFGAVRTSAELLNELRNYLFAKKAVMSIRRVSQNLFLKLHNLPLQWHLSKRTGEVVKAIDRGTRGANQILKASVFNIFPTVVELGLVYSVIFSQVGFESANVALLTCGAYASFTIKTTAWRTPFRRQMNAADNEAANLANDSLTNYETVKLFNNEKFEANRYDKQLIKYSDANLKVESSLAQLNFGQQAIITAGMTYL